MIKTCGFIFGLALLAALAPAAEIRVTFPNGGEKLAIPDLDVHWTYSGLAASTLVKITLSQNNSFVGVLDEKIPVSKLYGGKSFKKLKNGTPILTGSGYKVRVATMDDKVADKSDNPFTFFYYELPSVRSPWLGDKLELNSDCPIKWEIHYGSFTGTYRIELWKWGRPGQDRLVGVIADNVPSSKTKLPWKAGVHSNGTKLAEPGNGYEIAVYLKSPFGELVGTSGSIAFLPSAARVMVFPLNKSILIFNTGQMVSWHVSPGVPGMARLELLQNGRMKGVIARKAGSLGAADNTYLWKVGEMVAVDGELKVGDNYAIRVSYFDGPTPIHGESAPFSLRLRMAAPRRLFP